MDDRRDQRARRLAKIDALRDSGVDPYPIRFDRDHTIAEVREKHGQLAADTETTDEVRVAGRLMLKREQGKLTFAQLRDGTGQIQLFVAVAELGAERKRLFDDLDLGDWVGVEGLVMTSRSGELSIKVRAFELLAKSLRPLPKHHGLSDVDTRFRRRYADLIVNEHARRVFEIRFAAINAMRELLTDRGFVEVETPLLHLQAGGATAKPFETHHNALDLDLSLRVATELHLKRLIVGGYEKVFEIGRVFRNEGLGTRYNPEFTLLELYEAFVDYTDIMTLTEELVADAAMRAVGSTVIETEHGTVDFTTPWERKPMLDLIEEHGGGRLHPSMPVAELEATADRAGVPRMDGWGPGKLILEVYEKLVEPNLSGPVMVLDYPREVSPLARSHRDDPDLVERFEVVVNGRELANAYSELNDPVDQRRRFEAQARLRQLGDEEATDVDEDYIRALEYGMPPTGGLGIGVDRLIMLLAGVTTIREVILFPLLRPETVEEGLAADAEEADGDES
ncbi:MAG TPA: lysine--tRNA ligase [Acidimicrobiia bacterium]